MIPKNDLPKRPSSRRRRGGRRGSEFIEFAFVIMPLFAIIFVYLDMTWAIFVKATLQQALRVGVRYGITNAVPDPNHPGMCSGGGESLSACVKEHVQWASGNLLQGAGNAALITVEYQRPNSDGTLTLLSAGTAGANYGGNIIQVSIGKTAAGAPTQYGLQMLVPPFVSPLSTSTINMTLTSADTLSNVVNYPPS